MINDKSIMFLLLSVICAYVVLGEFYGNKPITKLLNIVMGD